MLLCLFQLGSFEESRTVVSSCRLLTLHQELAVSISNELTKFTGVVPWSRQDSTLFTLWDHTQSNIYCEKHSIRILIRKALETKCSDFSNSIKDADYPVACRGFPHISEPHACRCISEQVWFQMQPGPLLTCNQPSSEGPQGVACCWNRPCAS